MSDTPKPQKDKTILYTEISGVIEGIYICPDRTKRAKNTKTFGDFFKDGLRVAVDLDADDKVIGIEINGQVFAELATIRAKAAAYDEAMKVMTGDYVESTVSAIRYFVKREREAGRFKP